MKERIKRIYAKYGKYIKYVLIALIALSALFVLWGGAAWLILKDVSSQIEKHTLTPLTLEYQSNNSNYYLDDKDKSGRDKIWVTLAGTPYEITGTWDLTIVDGSTTISGSPYDLINALGTSASGRTAATTYTADADTSITATFTVSNSWLTEKELSFGSILKQSYTFTVSQLTLPAMKPVAKNGNNYYGTIDAALNAASSGQVVNVLILGESVDSGVAKKAKTITANIPAGVTLYVKHQADTDWGTSDKWTNESTREAKIAQPIQTKIEIKNLATTIVCANHVFVGANITNLGTIIVPADVTGLQTSNVKKYSTNADCSSIVYGDHSIIECLSKSGGGKYTITSGNQNTKAAIVCFGYIKGDVDLVNSDMLTLFSFLDHQGGSVLYGHSKLTTEDQGSFPLKRYFIASVEGQVTIGPKGALTGQSYVTASGTILGQTITKTATDSVVMLAGKQHTNNASAFLSLGENSYATLSYDPSATHHANKVTLYGSGTINKIAVAVDAVVVSGTMTTQYSMIPLSYLWEIVLDVNKKNGEITATVNTGENDIALLPGAKCVVEEGVNLDADRVAIYTSNELPHLNKMPKKYGTSYGEVVLNSSNKYIYKTGTETSIGNAKLIVKGTLTVRDGIGGPVTAGSPNAKINYTAGKGTVTCSEYSSHSGSTINTKVEVERFELKLSGIAMGYPVSKTPQTLASSASTYYSKEYETGAYAWYKNFTTTFNATEGQFAGGNKSQSYTVTVDENYNGIVSQLPTQPDRTHYTFKGWCRCTSATCTKTKVEFTTEKFYSDITFHAIWEPITYTLNFNWQSDGISGDLSIELPEPIPFTIETPTIPLTVPSSDYQFSGWFADESCSTDKKIAQGTTTLSGAELIAHLNGGTTVYGLWVSEQYSIKYETINDENGNPIHPELMPVTNKFTATQLPDAKLATITDTFISNTGEKYYFAGWKYGDQIYNAGDSLSFVTDGNLEYTLTANWVRKVSLTYKANNTSVYPELITNGSTKLDYNQTYWYVLDTTTGTTTVTLPNVKANDGYSTTNAYYFGGWTINADGNTSYQLSADTTVTINWIKKAHITFTGETLSSDPSGYYMPDSVITIPTLTYQTKWEVDTKTNDIVEYKFNGWVLGSTSYTEATYTVGSADCTFAADYSTTDTTYHKLTVTITESNGATVSITNSNGIFSYDTNTKQITKVNSVEEGSSAVYYTIGTVTITANDSDDFTSLSVKVNGGDNIAPSSGKTRTCTADVSTATTITVNADGKTSSGCFTPDTLITLADGTQKKIEDITYNDMLLVWDFNAGTYVAKPASTLINMGEGVYRVISLKFSDGTIVRMIDIHGFYDIDENKFVFINEENVATFIGHRFAKSCSTGFEPVTLVDYSIAEEYTTAYSILSYEHYNAIAEGMISVTPFPEIDNEAFYGCWIFDDDMTYNEIAMQELIEKHGLYTYEELAVYGITYDQFIGVNLAYLKVIVGEGAITLEKALSIMATFMP